MTAGWTTETLGACAALGSAFSWAAATIVFGRVGEDASPLAMNLCKGLITVLYAGIVLCMIGGYRMDERTFLLLGTSGLIGIALGDSLYFGALVRLGARMTTLLAMLAPVFVVLFSLTLLGERVGQTGLLGIACTLAGVALVSWSGVTGADGPTHFASGLLYIVGFAVCMAAGIILARWGVISMSHPSMLFEGVLVRAVWSVGALSLLGTLQGRMVQWLQPLAPAQHLSRLLLATTLVVFGGLYLSLVSLRYMDVSIASTLNATEPLFILPMTALILKQRIRPLELGGALLGVTGIAMLLHQAG
jgi:drug/metabolite transporter (DMT)-like permease